MGNASKVQTVRLTWVFRVSTVMVFLFINFSGSVHRCSVTLLEHATFGRCTRITEIRRLYVELVYIDLEKNARCDYS